MKRIVLGFSGSLASAAAIPWLRERHGAEVITVTIDVGQGEELAAVRERALALGAVRAHVIDAREEFVRDYLLPTLQAGAIMDGHALVCPLVARRLLELAKMESAAAIAHSARAGSLVEAVITAAPGALGAALEILSPADSLAISETELTAMVRNHGVHVPPSTGWRVEASLWGRRIEAADSTKLIEDAFTLTREPDDCPEYPALLDIEFVAGNPVAANGVEMPVAELIESLETIAGAHGVGRSRSAGVAFEMPAAYVLGLAHAELEARVLGDDLTAMKRKIAGLYSDTLLNGAWFSDLRVAIDAFTNALQLRVTGTVKLQLLKGHASVIACETRQAAPVGGPRAVA